jgi:hypothetical protein
MSNANLGTFRANNYLSVPVVLYDNSNVIMRLETTNMEVYAVTKRVTLTDNIVGGYNLTITNVSSVPIPGQYFTFDNYVTGATERTYMIETVTDLLDGYYRLTLSKPLELAIPDLSAFYMGTLSALPPGTNFDINTGEIYGRVPYQPKITQPYKFTITAVKIDATINEYETVTASKEFSITILGSITSEITWNSPSNLGSIPANYPSTLQVNASSNVTNATVLYYLTNGTLPPGVSLTLDGELIGTPNQYYNSSTGELGLTTFDGASMTFDKTQTTVDRSYTFTVLAEDQYQYSAKSQTFTVYITTPNTVAYSNITTQPFLAPTQRSAWKAFINNPTVFTPSSIYRPNDPNFGLQTNLSMLVYAGIQTEAAATYVGAMGLGFKRKRFKFDTVKTAVALDPITNNALYEIVYVQMIDPLETNGKHLPLSIKTTTNEPETITVDNNGSIYNDYNISVDSTGYEVSNPNTDTYYPSSISTWQARLSSTAKTSFDSNNTTFDNNTTIFEILTERNYLPLWMRSIPSGQKSEPGYVLCVPLCYCKPGTSSKIVTNIQYSGFDFKTIDYTVDRFTISAVTGYSSDKYLVFRDDRITV